MAGEVSDVLSAVAEYELDCNADAERANELMKKADLDAAWHFIIRRPLRLVFRWCWFTRFHAQWPAGQDEAATLEVVRGIRQRDKLFARFESVHGSEHLVIAGRQVEATAPVVASSLLADRHVMTQNGHLRVTHGAQLTPRVVGAHVNLQDNRRAGRQGDS